MRNTLPIGWREQGIIGGRQKRRAVFLSREGAARERCSEAYTGVNERKKEDERGKYLLGNIYTVYDLSGAKKETRDPLQREKEEE